MKRTRATIETMSGTLFEDFRVRTRTKVVRTRTSVPTPKMETKNPLAFPKNETLEQRFKQEMEQMHIDLEKDYKVPKRNFIYNDNVYELIRITDDAKYKGIDVISNEIIKAKQKDCVMVSKDDHFLIMLYWMYDYFKIVRLGKMKPIPFNPELNEYSDKWDKYGAMFCGNLMRTIKRKIIQAYGKDKN